MTTSQQELGAHFRAWILSREVEGFTVRASDETHLLLEGSAATGQVNFYPMPDGTEIVEMRIFRGASEDEQVFFLHFMMDDEQRARDLFGEMCEALADLTSHETTHVLLCCTCGITTNMFAHKMNEAARALALDYDFEAKALDRALAEGSSYSAVLLAPQVGYLRQQVIEAFPGAFVIELPGKVYGSYDAPAAVRLVTGVFDREETASEPAGDTSLIARNADFSGRYLVVSVVLGMRSTRILYRIYEGGNVVLEGATDKRSFDYRDVEDVLTAVRLRGIDPTSLDAVGIAVPGLVNDGVVSLDSRGIGAYDLRGRIREAYGIPVFVDNDTNAAVIACYVSQDAHRSVMFHRQPTGSVTCGQGTVIDGRLVTGHHHLAGELFYLESYLLEEGDVDAVWTEEGSTRVVARFLLCNICTVSPGAIYLSAAMAPDLDALRAELAKTLPEEHIPELLPAMDFGECIFLGELALCAQRTKR